MPLVQATPLEQTHDISKTAELDLCDPKRPVIEAECLLALLKNGDTVEDIRRLIEVPPAIEASLRAFIRANPEESFEIEHILSIRREVAKEFDRLVSM